MSPRTLYKKQFWHIGRHDFLHYQWLSGCSKSVVETKTPALFMRTRIADLSFASCPCFYNHIPDRFSHLGLSLRASVSATDRSGLAGRVSSGCICPCDDIHITLGLPLVAPHRKTGFDPQAVTLCRGRCRDCPCRPCFPKVSLPFQWSF